MKNHVNNSIPQRINDTPPAQGGGNQSQAQKVVNNTVNRVNQTLNNSQPK